ncbi:hypothetical protein Pmani_028470 [Petrolisthes manimaculis]|uniref:ETS domain-containing protein n=1 Tax=Petrolisthes manimaculis TaxID=1843537 RepID=A0AAE1TVN4_9EUCA|nr:hypothetical protein Pmani_028470 [Petrolisthes manimaculis]
MGDYSDLRASFTFELEGDDSIDRMCQTYLGDLDNIPASSTFSSGSSSLFPPQSSSSSSLFPSDVTYCTSPSPSSLSPYNSTGSLYQYSTSPNPCSLSPYPPASLSPNPSSLSPYASNSSLYASSPNPSSFCASDSGLLEEMETFTRMDVTEWRGEDCLDWASSVCRRRGLDQTTVDLWAFRNTNGAQLANFSMKDFCSLVGLVYGPLFHDELQEFQCRVKKECVSGGGDSSMSYCGLDDALDLTSEDIKDLDRYIVGGLQGMDLEGAVSLQYDNLENTPESVMLLSTGRSPSPPQQLSPLDSPTGTPSPTPSTATADPLMKIRPDPKKRERGPKNWEFVIRLLADTRHNPSLIRWEDQTQGTFRLVQPAVIANMWGKRAGRPNLSYDNFARGLRYHYTTGALQPVSEKQLVYRCGPKALKYLIDLKKGTAM